MPQNTQTTTTKKHLNKYRKWQEELTKRTQITEKWKKINIGTKIQSKVKTKMKRILKIYTIFMHDTIFKRIVRHHFSNNNLSLGVYLKEPISVYFSVSMQMFHPQLILFIDTILAHSKLLQNPCEEPTSLLTILVSAKVNF